MKRNLVIWVLTLMAIAPAFTFALAGPSDGGGTNLSIGEDELTDLLKFRKEYGDRQFLIEAKKFHIKGQAESVYSTVKPLLDRMIYFFPPMEMAINGAFEKPWIVVNAEFRPRNSAEKKVVAQTGDAVFISLPWLKTATVETLKMVWIHEAMRNFAIRYDHFAERYVGESTAYNIDESEMSEEEKKALQKKRDDFWARLPEMKAKAMDLIAEELTPFVYTGFPYALIKQSMVEISRKIHEEIFDKVIESLDGSILVGDRESIYKKLKGIKLRNLFDIACSGVTENGNPRSFRDLGQVTDNLLDISRNPYDYFYPSNVEDSENRPMKRHLRKGKQAMELKFYGIVADEPVSLSASLQLYAAILSGLNSLVDDSGSVRIKQELLVKMVVACSARSDAQILVEEFENDRKQIQDPFKAVTHNEIPEGMRKILKKF